MLQDDVNYSRIAVGLKRHTAVLDFQSWVHCQNTLCVDGDLRSIRHTPVVVQNVSEDILVDVGRERVIAMLPALSGAPFRAADEVGFAVLIGALVTCQNHLERSKINKKKTNIVERHQDRYTITVGLLAFCRFDT